MGRGYVVIEGHGEDAAILNLLVRLADDLGLPRVVWAPPIRRNALHREAATLALCDDLRRRPDCERALLLRDDEDGCPRKTGPEVASWVVQAALPFPTAVVLFYREYETLFLPCASAMAGKPLRDLSGAERSGLPLGATWQGDPEAKRDAKGAISALLGRRYKATIDQLALTRLLDFEALRRSGLPCFGTLERALSWLAYAKEPGVYPPPPRVAIES